MKMPLRWGLAALVLSLLACQPVPQSSETQAQPGAKSRRGGDAQPAVVYVEILTAATTRAHHSALGTWQARRILRLHNPEAGVITEIAGFEGLSAATGTVLVRLDARRAELALRQAQASLTLAQTDLQRLQQMGSKLTTAQALDQATNAQTQAQAAVALAQIHLADHTLKAPFAGVISERKQEPGDSVASHTHLLTLYDPDSLVLRVEMSEQRLNAWDSTELAQIQCPTQAPAAARVVRRHPTLEITRAYGIVEYQPTTTIVAQYPGGRCRVQWSDQPMALLTLPLRAVQQDERGEYVWVVNAAQKAEYRVVRSGTLQGDRVSIESGLQVGETVVVQGMADLRAKQAVLVLTPDTR